MQKLVLAFFHSDKELTLVPATASQSVFDTCLTCAGLNVYKNNIEK